MPTQFTDEETEAVGLRVDNTGVWPERLGSRCPQALTLPFEEFALSLAWCLGRVSFGEMP